jgi:hypothetical protein
MWRSVLFALICCGLPVAAQNPREIMDEVRRRAASKTFRYEGRITAQKAGGSKDEKVWRCERTGAPGQSKMLLRFVEPAEIRGVALLVWNHLARPSEIWLYTPALGRHRRIAQQDRSSRFAGTDFSFEDFEESDPASWEYSELLEAQEGGEACWRISARRAGPSRSQYNRQLIWVSKANMVVLRADKWRADQLARRLSMRSFEMRQQILTPMRTQVVDLLQNTTTTLELTEARYDERLPDSRFTLEALKGAW